MTGAHSRTFKTARVTVAPDRSRQVVSERNTFPQMTSLCWGGGERWGGWNKGWVLNQNLLQDCFLSTQVFLREHSVFSGWIKLHLQLIMNLIRSRGGKHDLSSPTCPHNKPGDHLEGGAET